MYANPEAAGNVRQLPLNLLDSIRHFENDNYLTKTLGSEFSTAYCKLKRADWDKYSSSLTPWERETTLDC